MSFCQYCGAECADGDRFCQKCGKPIVQAAAPADGKKKKGAAAPLDRMLETPRKAPAEKKVKKERTKPDPEKVRLTFGKALLCLFLCLLLFILTAVSGLSLSLRTGLSDNRVKGFVQSVDFLDISVPDEKGKARLLQDILTEQKGELLDQFGIKAKDVVKKLDQPYFRDFASDVLLEYRDYLFDGAKLKGLSADRVCEFLDDHAEDIEEDTDGILLYFDCRRSEIPVKRLNVCAEDVDDFFESLGTDTLNEKGIEKVTGMNPGLFKTLLSAPVLYAVSGAALLMLVILLLLNVHRIRRFFRFGGWTFVLSGLAVFFAGLVAARFARGTGISLVRDLSALATDRMMLVGGGILLLGILLAVPAVLICKAVSDKD